MEVAYLEEGKRAGCLWDRGRDARMMRFWLEGSQWESDDQSGTYDLGRKIGALLLSGVLLGTLAERSHHVDQGTLCKQS